MRPMRPRRSGVWLMAIACALVAGSLVYERDANGSEGSAARQAAVPTVTEVAHLRRVRAVLSYPHPREGLDVHEARLRIFHSGRLLVDERLLPPAPNFAVTPSNVWWVGSHDDRALVIRDLNGDGEPEVLVNLLAGGAHEFSYMYIYSYQPGTWFSRPMYHDIQHIWGDYGLRLQDLNRDRRPEFIGGDLRFQGRFADSAGSYLPIQIWQYRRGHLLDATRQFPAAVRRDLAAYRACLPARARRASDQRSCLAAWAADEALLGQSRAIWPVLETARKNENLAPHLGPDYPFDLVPRGPAFVAALRSFFRNSGYLR
jgi:hypothetical protein